MYHIERIEFLPSAFILIQTIVVLIISVLVVAKIDPGYEAVVLLLVISYFFVYLTKPSVSSAGSSEHRVHRHWPDIGQIDLLV